MKYQLLVIAREGYSATMSVALNTLVFDTRPEAEYAWQAILKSGFSGTLKVIKLYPPENK